MTIANQSGSSTGVNRITTFSGALTTTGPGSVLLMYGDPFTPNNWYVISWVPCFIANKAEY